MMKIGIGKLLHQYTNLTGLLHFTLNLYLIMLSVKQGGIS